jgi:sugar (pentulose or hexulose) kinase
MTQPYWAPGLKMPYAKGAIIGFGDVHTRAYVYRSVIEGLAYALKDGMIRIEKTGHCRMTKLGVSGGASQSEEICQIAADVFDRPILKGETHENSGLGAAIVTSVGAGLHSDFREAIGHMIRYGKTYEPDPRNVYIYRELFEKVYTKMFKAMKGFYQDIRKITGYPERID